jgi:hypothetical protein
MGTIPQIIGMITQILSILGVAFLVYKHFASADQAFDKTLGMNGTACDYKHRIIDDKFLIITQELKFIKENHLTHMEKDLSSIKTDIAIILDRENRSKTKLNI